MMLYQASPIKRNRATKAEMEERAQFLISYAREQSPVTVRQLFYAATVRELIEKSESGYNKVQAQVLALRREGRLPYRHIADATRYMRKPQTFDGWQAALQNTAQLYRKALWAETDLEVQVWVEKSALAGVIYPVTAEYDVPLMPTGGYTSETFAYGAVADLEGTGRKLVVYALYDFDRSGRDATASLREKVVRFGRELRVRVEFNLLGLTEAQVIDLDLPTRPPKRNTTADRGWPYAYAAELDAIPPDTLRSMVRDAIEGHLPAGQLEHLKLVEEAERDLLFRFIEEAPA